MDTSEEKAAVGTELSKGWGSGAATLTLPSVAGKLVMPR